MGVRRSAVRVCATVAVCALSLTMLAGTASAETPGVPAPTIPVGGGIDPDVLATVQNLATMCQGTVCTTAASTALDALEAASACLVATASGGVPPAADLALDAASLDCTGVVGLMEGFARFAAQTVTDCTSGTDAICRTVYDAASLGIERVRGCLTAVLAPSGAALGSTDPECASATAMLYREAEGAIALLTGCLNGSDAACTLARDTANFAINGLTGCVGALWYAYTGNNAPILPPGDPLPCYAVLDQVNVGIDSVLGQVPGLPTTISPTDDDCSIMVATPLPYLDLAAPSEAQPPSPDGATAFVPSCSEPESVQQTGDASFSTSPGGIVQNPTCSEANHYYTDKSTADGVRELWEKSFVNASSSTTVKTSINQSVHTGWSAKITTGAEAELSIWLGKIKAQYKVEVEATRDITWNVTQTVDLKPRTQGFFGGFVWTKVVEGRYVWTESDCDGGTAFRRIRAPYKDTWFYWEEPYDGKNHP